MASTMDLRKLGVPMAIIRPPRAAHQNAEVRALTRYGILRMMTEAAHLGRRLNGVAVSQLTISIVATQKPTKSRCSRNKISGCSPARKTTYTKTRSTEGFRDDGHWKNVMLTGGRMEPSANLNLKLAASAVET